MKILKICNSLPPLTTLRRCFRNTVFLRNYLLTKYLSLPVNILRNFQRVGILNTNQNTHYHQPNGFVERLIHTLKRILKKAKYNQQEEYLALFFFFFLIHHSMKIEFLQPQNYLTFTFTKTYTQSSACFQKIRLLLKLLDPVKQPIGYGIFYKEIPSG